MNDKDDDRDPMDALFGRIDQMDEAAAFVTAALRRLGYRIAPGYDAWANYVEMNLKEE